MINNNITQPEMVEIFGDDIPDEAMKIAKEQFTSFEDKIVKLRKLREAMEAKP